MWGVICIVCCHMSFCNVSIAQNQTNTEVLLLNKQKKTLIAISHYLLHWCNKIAKTKQHNYALIVWIIKHF